LPWGEWAEVGFSEPGLPGSWVLRDISGELEGDSGVRARVDLDG
jgi:hypothetical protein